MSKHEASKSAPSSGPTSIAIIGLGCWLPGAANPRELWENILARRREFRRMPDGRTPLADYHDPTRGDPDKFYQSKAAVIDGFRFDWASYRIPESTFVGTDVSQWLALEVAQQALADAGYTRASLPKERTGVFVGNTCTGEDMRSNLLRLRWPVIRRAMLRAGELRGIPEASLLPFVKVTEDCYKSIFPQLTEDFVAGSISATIAGRICNHFDLHGGGFVVDGACASSLATVITAANLLCSGDLDLALAGGVDISLDPFELVGFSRNGALSADDIRPYDRRGDGFLPGEGAGMVVLKRLEDARRDGDAIYAVMPGWGLASDGKAGIMQPVARQQAAAIRRAIDRAGFRMDTLDFVEGHGTGTRAGDRTEIEGLSIAMAGSPEVAGPSGRRFGVGSLKSIIGHTKATAGVASLIKAVMAVNRRVVPPTANCEQRNEAFEGPGKHFFPIALGEVRETGRALRAGVSAYGFGGINTHVIVESAGEPSPKLRPGVDERALLVSSQDGELFVFGGPTREAVLEQLRGVAADAPLLSQGDLTDLAAALASRLPDTPTVRAAVIAGTPDELAARLELLRQGLMHEFPGEGALWRSPRGEAVVGRGAQPGRLGFVFPGQGSQQLLMARTLFERYEWARELAERAEAAVRRVSGVSVLDHMYRPIDRVEGPDELKAWSDALARTEVAQPAICLASLQCVRYLQELGITPAVVAGHSLGELTALHVAGAFGVDELFELAALRGEAMRAQPQTPGAMASLACAGEQVARLLADVPGTVVVANLNSPQQTVISGEAAAVDGVLSLAAAQGVSVRRLPVSNAFHSPLVADGARHFEARAMLPESWSPRVPVISGVSGAALGVETGLRRHLGGQITSPVDFIALARAVRGHCDALIEAGPGRVLSGLCRDIFDADLCVPLAADALRWNPNQAVAMAFALGVAVRWPAFHAQRLVRPYRQPAERVFLANPAQRPITFRGGDSPDAAAGSPGGAWGPRMGGVLAAELGWEPSQWADYLRRRGSFLAGVARLDAASAGPASAQAPAALAHAGAEPAPAGSPRAPRAHAPAAAVEPLALLVELVSQRTGYAAGSITAGARLLDDLNLDSIKAGELVAEALRRVGQAGALDASRFANASLQEIADALTGLSAGAAPHPVPAAPSGEASEPVDPAQLVIDIVHERTGYARASIQAGSRLLDDLNLDSIKAGEVVAEALRRIGAPGALDASRFANATIADVAAALSRAMPTAPAVPAAAAATAAVAADHPLSFVLRHPSWTRHYVVRAQPMPRLAGGSERWQHVELLILFDAADSAPAEALAAEVAALGGRGTLVAFDAAERATLQKQERFTHQIACLPRRPTEGSDEVRLARMVRRVTSLAQVPLRAAPEQEPRTVAYLQFGEGFFGAEEAVVDPELANAMAFARTLHLERSDLKVRVVDVSASLALAEVARRLLDELGGEEALRVVGYDAQLTRRVPAAALSDPASHAPRGITWGRDDVILVTGGAKGILAECALGLARATGATLVLVGRSPAASGTPAHAEIQETLARFEREQLRHRYYACDIVDADALETTLQRVESELGPITAVVHGASVLRPCRAEGLTVEGTLQEIGSKVLGAWNLCRAFSKRPLKLFVAFSSLVVDHGMPWSSGYGFANEVMERVLRAYGARQAGLPLQIVSFGLWGEVGRPAVLNTNQHLLSVGLHDGEIAPEVGVRCFVDAFVRDPAVQRLCVYGRSVGYGPWEQLRSVPAVPHALRFVERVLHLEPGVELIGRCRLNLTDDLYLLDHVYNGMHIVPTVFALEALAQAAHALAGGVVPLCRIEAVEMPSPVVVDPVRGTELELRAEWTGGGSERRVEVQISSEQSGFRSVAVRGTVVFCERAAGDVSALDLAEPVPIDPQTDLYGRHFFVGPRYQRMESVYSVEPSSTVCVGTAWSAHDAAQAAFGAQRAAQECWLLLGDPFFRDTLLHSSLVHHLAHMAFTARIDRVELFAGSEAAASVRRACVARLIRSQGKDAEYVLEARSLEGQLLERWTGFASKALASAARWPGTQELLDTEALAARDEAELRRAVAAAAQRLQLSTPSLALDWRHRFSELPRPQRRGFEQRLAQRLLQVLDPALACDLHWTPEGKPQLIDAGALDISFSHEGPYCLGAGGAWVQGCDLTAPGQRSLDDWQGLLGDARGAVLRALGTAEPPAVAGARVWAALEAARKAGTEGAESVTLLRRDGDHVLLRVADETRAHAVLTLPLALRRGPPLVLAVVVQEAAQARPAAAAERQPHADAPAGTRVVHDERLGCDVLEHLFHVTWKECTSPSRKVMTATIVEWFHRARELMLSAATARRLMAGVLDGSAGLVARSIQVRLHAELTAHDLVRARIWASELSETVASWRVEFFHVGSGEADALAASVSAHGSVVGTRRHGDAGALAPFRRFLQTRTPGLDAPESPLAGLTLGDAVAAAPAAPRAGPVLFRHELRPTRMDSDLVGNVSSVTYFQWLAHVRDLFLHGVVPAGGGRPGHATAGEVEALCVGEELAYLREAFPFDEISAELSLVSATRCGLDLRCDFFRRRGGAREKLATARQQLAWVRREGDRHAGSVPLPEAVLAAVAAGAGAQRHDDMHGEEVRS